MGIDPDVVYKLLGDIKNDVKELKQDLQNHAVENREMIKDCHGRIDESKNNMHQLELGLIQKVDHLKTENKVTQTRIKIYVGVVLFVIATGVGVLFR